MNKLKNIIIKLMLDWCTANMTINPPVSVAIVPSPRRFRAQDQCTEYATISECMGETLAAVYDHKSNKTIDVWHCESVDPDAALEWVTRRYGNIPVGWHNFKE